MSRVTATQRADARNFARRFGLPQHLAEKLAKTPDSWRTAFLDRVEEFRTRDGQCLPTTCPLVAGFVRNEVAAW